MSSKINETFRQFQIRMQELRQAEDEERALLLASQQERVAAELRSYGMFVK